MKNNVFIRRLENEDFVLKGYEISGKILTINERV